MRLLLALLRTRTRKYARLCHNSTGPYWARNTWLDACHTTHLAPGGAMPVPLPVPCGLSTWPHSAFGSLGEGDTPLFREPARERASLRLSLLLAAGKELLPNVETGITIGVAAHTTRGTEYLRTARSRVRGCVAVARDLRFTDGALAARIARAHLAGDDPPLPTPYTDCSGRSCSAASTRASRFPSG